MKSRIAIAISALTLGTALAAVPSFAQTSNQPNGTAAQGQSSGCISFQTGCSDKPYPMGENASPTGAQNSERTGSQGNRQARSASGGERVNNGQTSGNRERLSSQRLGRERPSLGVNQQGRVGVAEGQRVEGGTFGYGQPPQYYNSAPGMRVAGADRGATWCATRFQSFDPATGTYMGFDGIRHACP